MPSGERAGPKRLENREQRREEVLALYAKQPLGIRMSAFLKAAEVGPSVWYEWMRDPDFVARFAEVQQARRTVVLEPLERDLGDIISAHSRAGRAGEGWAVRLAYEVLGLIKPASQSVRVNTVVSAQTATHVEATQEEILAEHTRLRLHVLRLQERAKAIEGDSGDTGPAGDGGGSGEEPGALPDNPGGA